MGCRRSCGPLLATLDCTMSLLVVSPLVVGYWRGCWQLMDLFLFPGDTRASVYSSLVIGVLPAIIFCLSQNHLEKLFDAKTRPILHVVGSRLYTVIFSLTCVNHWRGVWQLWDLYTGTSWQSGAVSTVLGMVLLIITRGVRNILAPPFVICPDKPQDYFHVPTLFNAQGEKGCSRLTDALFTVVFTDSLVVFVWRGAWVLLDRLLYPNHPGYSAIGSLVVGVALTVLAFLFQRVVALCTKPLAKGWLKVLLEDLFSSFCFVATVNVWRGVWAALNVYFLKDSAVLSNLVTAVAGQLLLTLCYCANSILVRGAVMDGSLPQAQGVTFSTDYFRYFCQGNRGGHDSKPDYWTSPVHVSQEQSSSVSDPFNKCNGGSCGSKESRYPCQNLAEGVPVVGPSTSNETDTSSSCEELGDEGLVRHSESPSSKNSKDDSTHDFVVDVASTQLLSETMATRFNDESPSKKVSDQSCAVAYQVVPCNSATKQATSKKQLQQRPSQLSTSRKVFPIPVCNETGTIYTDLAETPL